MLLLVDVVFVIIPFKINSFIHTDYSVCHKNCQYVYMAFYMAILKYAQQSPLLIPSCHDANTLFNGTDRLTNLYIIFFLNRSFYAPKEYYKINSYSVYSDTVYKYKNLSGSDPDSQIQLSISSPGTRSNSLTLFVINSRADALACPAIIISYGPMGLPILYNEARI